MCNRSPGHKTVPATEAAEDPPVLLGLGANIGDARASLAKALAQLATHPQITIVAYSGDYFSPPWGITAQAPYCNGVVHLKTSLAPRDLLTYCKDIERKMGRTPGGPRWQARVIDIDILFYGQLALETPDLTIPHPYIARRAFVLVPLLALFPDYRLADGRNARAVVQALPEFDQIRKMTPGETMGRRNHPHIIGDAHQS